MSFSRRLVRALSSVPAAPPGGPNHRAILTLDGHSIRPFVQPNAYVAPSASVIGSVVVNDMSAVLYGAVVRGDLAVIHVGAHTTIGENAVLTAGQVGREQDRGRNAEGMPVKVELMVGDYTKVGAGATLHGCWLDGENRVGEGVKIGNGVRLEKGAEILPGSVVKEGTWIDENEVWEGVPARKVGMVSDEDRIQRQREREKSWGWIKRHMYEFLPEGTAYWEKEKLGSE